MLNDLIGVVKTYDDIEENWKKGKMSALLTIEEGGVCQGDLMLLRFFYHLGVRMMTLTWNYPNELGYPNRLASNSSYFPSNGADDTVLGLTEKGIQFVEEMEPTDVGADMIVGSLIKNPGGGLAPIGGYIVGRRDCVERAAYRLTAPGLGKEVGASLGVSQSLYQGLFLSPTVVAGALKGAIFAANVYEKLGFGVVPNGTESRHDIIQAITFGTPEGVIKFCEGIQAAAPVDSFVTPEPWAMPGYDSDVIMAAGAFVQGSSIELSADGPIKPPYAVYFQGGLTWYHAKLGILMSLQKLVDAGIVTL